ncbi:MAG: thiamine diphosphokinase [Oscillospiraceae bacterium]|nr:thiamine diphosphokinase [Oscillospiraceae bacterium]
MEDNVKVCSVICGTPCGFDKSLVSGFVIAADSGLDRCKAAGITPDLVVGDFDSAKTTVPENTERVTVPSEKDDTDTFLASRIAVERGYNELRFFCALGGRVSHSLANVQMLRDLKRKGVRAALFGERCVMFLLENESLEIPRFEGYLSLFAFDKTAVVSESGVKYPLVRHTLSNDFPLGVSNEIKAERGLITVHSGLCAVVLEEEG